MEKKILFLIWIARQHPILKSDQAAKRRLRPLVILLIIPIMYSECTRA